jgi:3',5'-cyclic AMP phosphodiesterase CpdA
MFVLAHLSDAHLAPVPVPSWPELLGKRATGYLNWKRKRRLIHRSEVLAAVVSDLRAHMPDHIAVTGDLINISLEREYPSARIWLESLGAPEKVSLVPGNHDIYVRAARPYLRLHWGEYMRGDDCGQPEFPYMRRRGPIALIGLSSAISTPPFMATGQLGETQINALRDLLDRCHREQLFRVLLIHHPPLSSPGRHYKRLLDAARLRCALKHCGAELVIHGHDHVPSLIYLEGPQGPIPTLGVPSASQVARAHGGAGYNLFYIEGGSRSWSCETVARGLAPDGHTLAELRRVKLC